MQVEDVAGCEVSSRCKGEKGMAEPEAVMLETDKHSGTSNREGAV